MRYESKQLDVAFVALANKQRRTIVYRLSLQPSSITKLADELGLSLPSIHRHIRILEEAKLLQRKKIGRSNFLALNRNALNALRSWIDQYHAYWGNNEESLENYVQLIESQSQKKPKRINKSTKYRMKKFVFVYHGRVRPEDVKKEDMQKTMDAWMGWFGTFKDKMIDGGNPLATGAQSVTDKGVKALSLDMSAKGYSIINANDMEEAVKIAKGCPALKDDPEGAVHVYEALPM